MISLLITYAVVGFDFDLFVWGMFCSGAFLGCIFMFIALACVTFVLTHKQIIHGFLEMYANE